MNFSLIIFLNELVSQGVVANSSWGDVFANASLCALGQLVDVSYHIVF